MAQRTNVGRPFLGDLRSDVDQAHSFEHTYSMTTGEESTRQFIDHYFNGPPLTEPWLDRVAVRFVAMDDTGEAPQVVPLIYTTLYSAGNAGLVFNLGDCWFYEPSGMPETFDFQRRVRERNERLGLKTPEIVLAAVAKVFPVLPGIQYPFEDPTPRETLEAPISLTGPRIRQRKMLQPPILSLIFDACAVDKMKAPFQAFVDGDAGGLRYQHRRGVDYLQLQHPEPVPLNLRNANVERETVEAWARAGVRHDLERLDDIAWDVVALAMTAFYARTPGASIDARFPLMVDDYLEWRGVDPRNRTEDLRQDVYERIRLICSDRFSVFSQATLHLTNPETGRRKKESFTAKGPLLVRAEDLYRNGQARLQFDGRDRPDGVLVLLGEWARQFVEEKAMLGVFLKTLAEYDMRRQQWERRLGWYLTFQMNNQATKALPPAPAPKGKGARAPVAQHGIKMRTVLNGARIEWQETAATNPARIIKQWGEALAVLHDDGIIDARCLDGAPDGSDLSRKGRLDAMLERSWEFVPGRELAKHIGAKQEAARKSRRGKGAPGAG